MRKVALVVLAAGGLACAGLVSAGPVPVGPADMAVVPTVEDVVAARPSLSWDPALESWTLTRNADGSYELEYSYEADAFLVSSLAYVEASASDANWVWTGAGIGLDIGISGEDGLTLVPLEGALTWGDRRECQTVLTEGVEVGTVCRAQLDRRVLFFMIVGASFTEPGSMDRAFAAELAALETWQPTAKPE